jgi:hypothetical protein
MSWYFFGVLCVHGGAALSPPDCTRIVFDAPMEVTDLRRPGKVPPLVFHSAGECMLAIKQLDRQKPYAAMGSQWTEIGCTQGHP